MPNLKNCNMTQSGLWVGTEIVSDWSHWTELEMQMPESPRQARLPSAAARLCHSLRSKLGWVISSWCSGYVTSFFYQLPSLSSQANELVCLYKQENKPDVWILILLSRAQLESRSEPQPVMMSAMVLDDAWSPRKYYVETYFFCSI